MHYTNYQIEEAKAYDIVRLAHELGLPLTRKGSQYMTRCVVHDDVHPSMQVGGRMNLCKCYACGASLNPLQLVMRIKGCGFREAMRLLTGQPLSPSPFPRSGEGEWSHSSEILGSDPIDSSASLKTYHPERCNYSPFPERGKGQGDRGCIYFNPKYVGDMVTGKDGLTKCLLRLFDAEAVSKVVLDYQMGCWTDRRYVDNTLFPIIDSQGRIHNLKLQHYDSDINSEQFAHCDKKHTFWLGAILQREGKLAAGRFDNEVLFGEHLLKGRPSAVVGLVESPKNAIVAACEFPQLVWVATGNKGMLKRSVLLPLRGRDVLVYPDEDAYEEWREKLEGMRDVANFHIAPLIPPPEGKAATGKSDIADVIIASLVNSEASPPALPQRGGSCESLGSDPIDSMITRKPRRDEAAFFQF